VTFSSLKAIMASENVICGTVHVFAIVWAWQPQSPLWIKHLLLCCTEE